VMNKSTQRFFLAFVIVITMILISSCSIFSGQEDSTQNLSSSETVFEATLPVNLPETDTVFLEIIDEVTGIDLNPTRYPMEKKDDRSVFARIPITNGSLVKYRYVLRSESDVIEKNANGNQIEYRMALVKRPSIINDSILNWTDDPIQGLQGEISGYVFDQKTNLPVPDVLVSINGLNSVTGPNGFYEINQLPVGEFRLTAAHINGIYEPFQQGAVIAENALTPASFGMEAAKLVNVSFELRVPENTLPEAPIRMIGNTVSTGNMLTAFNAGTSVVPARAPKLDRSGDGLYSLIMELPAGLDFRYKYSLGDGFVNAERSENSDFYTRQFIVPDRDTKVKNVVYSWGDDPSINPIEIEITIPADTGDAESISIQFNPYEWMTPIPTWKHSDNQRIWSYALYGPFEYLDSAQFRICKNDQCGKADDALTAGKDASGFILNINDLKKTGKLTYELESWVGSNNSDFNIIAQPYRYQKPGFISGIGFSDQYNPLWLPYYDWGIIDAAISGANFIAISPLKAISNSGYLVGDSYSIDEVHFIHKNALDAGMDLILFPQLDLGGKSLMNHWKSADTSYHGWKKWFEEYSTFVLSYAMLSEQLDLDYIVLGGTSVAPALPDGRFPDGNVSNTPFDMSDWWEHLIIEIKDDFNGQIIFAIPDSLSAIDAYAFLDQIDGIMVITDNAISSKDAVNNDDSFYQEAVNLLDQSFYALVEKYYKPIILALQYASIDGSATNCANLSDSCFNLVRSPESNSSLPIDLDEQANLYQAFYSASLTRDWITGLVSMGYDPSVTVLDAGLSTRGKPAFDVITYYNNQIIQDF